jgi:hypothetical protein
MKPVEIFQNKIYELEYILRIKNIRYFVYAEFQENLQCYFNSFLSIPLAIYSFIVCRGICKYSCVRGFFRVSYYKLEMTIRLLLPLFI